MARNNLYLLSLLFIVSSSPVFAQQTFGILTIDLAVQNNKLFVAHSTFEANEIAYPEGTEAKLVDYINGTFEVLDEELRRDSSLECFANSKSNNDGLLNSYQTLTLLDTRGEGLAMAYLEAMPDADIQFDFRQYIFNVIGQCLWLGSPIMLDADQFDISNYQFLSFPLQIRPPVDPQKMEIVYDQQDTLSRKKVKRILHGLENALWFEKDIQEKLDKYYFLLNNELTYHISDTLIRVIPQKISRVQVTTDNPEEISPVFYNLLPTPLFRKYLEIPADSLQLKNEFSEKKGFNFSLFKEGQTEFNRLPIFETDAFQIHQMQLNKLQYSLSVNPTPSNIFEQWDAGTDLEQYVDVVANKISLAQTTDTSNVNSAAPMPNADGVMGVSGQHNGMNGFGHDRLMDEPDGKTHKPKRNYLGLGFDYYIEDAFQVNGIFQRMMKNGSTISAKIGYAFNENGIANGGMYLSGSYFKDFVFFQALKKRMSVQLTANTLFTANRIILGESLKERRSGAKILTELEWFRDISGNLLLSRFSLASQKVTLNNFNDIGIIDTTIAFAEIGFLHNYFKNSAQFATRLVIEPVFKFGISGVNSSAAADFYVTSRLHVRLNQSLPNGFAVNLDVNTEIDSKKTPVFEQYALQTNQNRGFKEDAVIGRASWSLQPECWIPLPRLGDKWGKLNQYLYKHIRLAAFSDISYFDKMLVQDGKKRGYWFSPGLGIRFIKFPTQINLDWAYGSAPNNLLARRSQFSINLIVNAPL